VIRVPGRQQRSVQAPTALHQLLHRLPAHLAGVLLVGGCAHHVDDHASGRPRHHNPLLEASSTPVVAPTPVLLVPLWRQLLLCQVVRGDVQITLGGQLVQHLRGQRQVRQGCWWTAG
jgi:hypothetical protein